MRNLNLLKKEFTLGINKISTGAWLLCAIFMQMIPDYPLYVGPFYITLGIMLTFALNQTSHDILYTVLLPVKKTDTVKARFLFCGILECFCVIVSLICGIIRAAIHFQNNAAGIPLNVAYIGLQLVVFTVFNLIYLGNVYKNPLKSGMKYLFAAVAYFAMYVICELPVWIYRGFTSNLEKAGLEHSQVMEELSNLPALAPQRIGYFLTQTDFLSQLKQIPVLVVGIVIFALGWIITFKTASRQFEKYDM